MVTEILHKILTIEAGHAIAAWYTRVPSKSNVADDPSRAEVAQLVAEGAKCDSVHCDTVLDAIIRVNDVGGEDRPVAPNW